MPPLTILRGTPPQWTFADQVLAMATTLAEEMRCAGCGMPKHESYNPDSEGHYEPREATCNGCAALRRASEGEREHRPEVKRWVKDVRPIDEPLRPWKVD